QRILEGSAIQTRGRGENHPLSFFSLYFRVSIAVDGLKFGRRGAPPHLDLTGHSLSRLAPPSRERADGRGVATPRHLVRPPGTLSFHSDADCIPLGDSHYDVRDHSLLFPERLPSSLPSNASPPPIGRGRPTPDAGGGATRMPHRAQRPLRPQQHGFRGRLVARRHCTCRSVGHHPL